MGKSPGKWIKGIIFGKKPSKSILSDGRELSRSASEKPARVSFKDRLSTSIANAPLISDPLPDTVVDRINNSSFGKGKGAILENNVLVSSSSNENGDPPSDPGLPYDPEKIRLEHAAIVVQASFRSYQARRAFWTLKGIIRLQAAVRGRLVRRQAVATLFCIQGVVKFQAITRGYMVRQSIIGNRQGRKQSLIAKESCEIKCSPADTLLSNAFIYELLSSSPTAMPLSLHYGPGEPNSAWAWLLRWSLSQVWGPNPKQKETGNSKLQNIKTEQTKPKCNGKRTVRNNAKHANGEKEKLKHIGREAPSQSGKSGQEHLHAGNDKAKRGLKKIQKPTGEVSNEAEIDVEKPKRYPRKLSKSPAPKFSEGTSNSPIDKPVEGLAEATEHDDLDSCLELHGTNSPSNQLTSSQEHHKLVGEKTRDIFPVDKDKDDGISCDKYKSTRRISLPAECDDQDATPESVTRVPSYMARTASSKAKAKVQVSPRFEQDVVDKKGLTRRHSLPSPINGKITSSPRVHMLVQADGTGVKTDKSLSSSRDVSDKATRVEWKR